MVITSVMSMFVACFAVVPMVAMLVVNVAVMMSVVPTLMMSEFVVMVSVMSVLVMSFAIVPVMAMLVVGVAVVSVVSVLMMRGFMVITSVMAMLIACFAVVSVMPMLIVRVTIMSVVLTFVMGEPSVMIAMVAVLITRFTVVSVMSTLVVSITARTVLSDAVWSGAWWRRAMRRLPMRWTIVRRGSAPCEAMRRAHRAAWWVHGPQMSKRGAQFTRLFFADDLHYAFV